MQKHIYYKKERNEVRKMITKFAIIGGDLRMIKLAKLLAKDKKLVYTLSESYVEPLVKKHKN